MFTHQHNNTKYRITFEHFNPAVEGPKQNVSELSPGTLCVIETDNQMVALAHSRLHPKAQFCRSTGRKVSLGRALLMLFPGEENKAVRRDFWYQYFAVSPLSLRRMSTVKFSPHTHNEDMNNGRHDVSESSQSEVNSTVPTDSRVVASPQ